uniref:Uncharacterized protein n=1 Tax=Moniliophthora roreri TaxID=221103 RepID=A0A0W0GEA0_MONRR
MEVLAAFPDTTILFANLEDLRFSILGHSFSLTITIVGDDSQNSTGRLEGRRRKRENGCGAGRQVP